MTNREIFLTKIKKLIEWVSVSKRKIYKTKDQVFVSYTEPKTYLPGKIMLKILSEQHFSEDETKINYIPNTLLSIF